MAKVVSTIDELDAEYKKWEGKEIELKSTQTPAKIIYYLRRRDSRQQPPVDK